MQYLPSILFGSLLQSSFFDVLSGFNFCLLRLLIWVESFTWIAAWLTSKNFSLHTVPGYTKK